LLSCYSVDPSTPRQPIHNDGSITLLVAVRGTDEALHWTDGGDLLDRNDDLDRQRSRTVLLGIVSVLLVCPHTNASCFQNISAARWEDDGALG